MRCYARGRIYSWFLAALLPVFMVLAALANPIEEHALDAARSHILRGVVFTAARADGWLYPRWVQATNGGLGGPLFSFYPPLAYYLMDGLHGLGLPQPLAWRLLVALALLAVSTGTFALGLKLFHRAGVALACATAAAYAPYLLQEYFRRGSPEGLALALAPWMLWSLYRLAEHPAGLRLAGAGACWAAMILLHNVTALLFLPIVAVFLVFIAMRIGVRPVVVCLLGLLAGLLLSAFFLLPFVVEGQYVQLENAGQVDKAQSATASPLLADLFLPPPVFDSGLGNNALPRAVAGPLAALALSAGPALALLWRQRSRSAEAFLVAGLWALGLLVTVLQFSAAAHFWLALPPYCIQFRWRLLGGLGLAVAVLLGYLIAPWPARWRGAAASCLVLVSVGCQLPYLYPRLLPRHVSFPASLTVADVQALAFKAGVPALCSYGELVPRWRQRPFTPAEAKQAAAMPIANLPNWARVLVDDRRNGQWDLTVETPAAFSAALHLLYFPGWTASVDGIPQALRPAGDGSGYTLIDLPAGRHRVELRYAGTLAQHLGDWITIAGAVLLLLVAALWQGENKKPTMVADIVYLQPRWWLPVGLLLLAGLKGLWLDPHTNFLRLASTLQTVAGAQVQTDVWFDERIHLRGYTVARPPLAAAGRLRLTLYWELNQPAEDLAYSFVHLLGTTPDPQMGYPLWSQEEKHFPAEDPISNWEQGKIYRDTYDLQVPPGITAGEYQLEIGWWWPSTGQRLKPRLATPGDTLALSPADSLLAFEHVFRPPTIGNRRRETLGQTAALLGYDLEPAVIRPGGTLHLKLYWQTLAPMPANYTVFTHLLDARGQMRAGHDGTPVSGLRPTTNWLEGEVLTDLHEIVMPTDAQPGRYTIEVGLYDPANGVRLPAYDATGKRLDGDRVLLGTVIVE